MPLWRKGGNYLEAVEDAGPSDLPNLFEAVKGEDNPNRDATTSTTIPNGSWKYATPCFTNQKRIFFKQVPCYCYGGGG